MNVALKIDLVGEHVDDLHHESRGDACVNSGLVKVGIDVRSGVLVTLFKFAAHGFGEIIVRRREMDIYEVIDSRRERKR